MKLYSWKDIERHCLMNRSKWNTDFEFIECYPAEIIVGKKSQSTRTVEEVFEELFSSNFDAQEMCVRLDIGKKALSVFEDNSLTEGHGPITPLPLFRDILYHPTSYPQKELPELSCPLIAFHSYKGGVGRTLSLIAFAKAWSSTFAGTKKGKLLIIDSDIEAPGLTWLQQDVTENTFSYLDLLELIQDNTNVNEIVDLACSKIGTSTITIETSTQSVEHIFIPTYRYKEQLLDMYASPETIVNRKDKEYLLAQVITAICKKMGAAAALIDLRAGISEFSSTILLDPRVKKYLVTSTSLQSVNGTKIILEYLTKGLCIRADTILPAVFLSMVPEGLPEKEKSEIIGELLQCYDQPSGDESGSSLLDNVLTELPFASELIHLTSLQQILQNLNNRDMYFAIQKLIDENYCDDIKTDTKPISTEYRNDVLSKIHALASEQLTAEGNSKFDLLMTEPLKYLEKKHRDTLPTTVIMGAKGSGKTFLYRKFIESKSWTHFCDNLSRRGSSEAQGFFFPVVATKNVGEMLGSFKACIDNVNYAVPNADANNVVFLDNSQKIEQKKGEKTNWFSFWEELLATSFNPKFKSFEEVNQALNPNKKKIIFLVDGLEEIFKDVSKQEEERCAVRTLCQDVVNQLAAKYSNIGIIVFLRRDMAHDAINVNFEQFVQTFGRAELKWSSNEALRLAVWLVSQAVDGFYQESVGIEVASQDIIEKHLIKLWGLKLGKPTSNEAYSSRWILAALSDFNGQLQARDIIRFLKYAATPTGKKGPYDDRFLMPAEIKDAVSRCSSEKIEEVKLEYAALNPIFGKLDQLEPEYKKLPLDQSHAALTPAEEKAMIQEGYLKRDGDKYYLPEIIRHALNFRYDKGARPKVLSLLLKR